MQPVFFLAGDRLHAMLDETTHTREHTVTDKVLDLLEFIASVALCAGFIFLSAFVLVGSI